MLISHMTTRGLKIDASTGDVVVTGGVLQLTEGTDAIAQAVRSALRLIKGEWFVNTDAGVDYFGKILSRKPADLGAARREFETAILAVPGVAEITLLELSLDEATRILSVTIEATTDTDELITATETVET